MAQTRMWFQQSTARREALRHVTQNQILAQSKPWYQAQELAQITCKLVASYVPSVQGPTNQDGRLFQ